MMRAARLVAAVLVVSSGLSGPTTRDGAEPRTRPEDVAVQADHPRDDGSAGDDVVLSDRIVLSEWTTFLDEQTLDQLMQIRDDGTLLFAETTQQLDALEAGDVIVSPPSDRVPSGIAHQIMNIQSFGFSGRSVLIETAPAAPDQVYEQGDLYLEVEFGPDGEATHRMVLPEGMRGADLKRDLLIDGGADLEECDPDDRPLPEHGVPGIPCVEFGDTAPRAEDCGATRRLGEPLTHSVPETWIAPGVTAVGEVELSLTLCMYWSVLESRFFVVIGGEQSSSIDLVVSGDHAHLDERKRVDTITLPRVLLGTLRVWPSIDLFVEVTGDLDASLTATLAQHTSALVGAAYVHGWHNVSHGEVETDVTLEATGDYARVQAGLVTVPTLKVSKGGLCLGRFCAVELASGTIRAEIRPYLEVDATEGGLPYCRMIAGLTADLSVRLKELLLFGDDYEDTVIRRSEPVRTCWPDGPDHRLGVDLHEERHSLAEAQDGSGAVEGAGQAGDEPPESTNRGTGLDLVLPQLEPDQVLIHADTDGAKVPLPTESRWGDTPDVGEHHPSHDGPAQ